MRASWHALHAHLVKSADRHRFQSEFRQLAACREPLAGLADPPALLERLHAPGGDPEGRNVVLRALVEAAQLRNGSSETATALLLLALWPGLDAVHGRLIRHFRDDPAALTSEISARITLGIRKLDLARVSRIAATLIRNTERDIRRDLVRETDRRRTHDLLDEAVIPAASNAGSVNATDALAGSICDALGRDGPLVVAVVLDRLSRKAAARQLGLSHDVARKRLGRAMARLAQNSGKS